MQRIVLHTIYAAGILSVVVVAPNAAKALQVFDPFFKKRKRHPKYALNRSLGTLLDKGFITFEQTPNGKFLRLTPLGEQRLRALNLTKIHAHQKKRKWDKKWRMIIFDIPASKNALRNKIRYTLQEIGFYKLQHSVWIYPYDCENLITMLKVDFKIGKDVLYIIADQIENDRALKAHFDLK